MEFNRNQFFLVGLVILFCGIQLRLLDSVVLNEKASHFLAQRMGTKSQATASQVLQATGLSKVAPRRVIHPPEWVGWFAISMGAVLVLHSLALRRPG